MRYVIDISTGRIGEDSDTRNFRMDWENSITVTFPDGSKGEIADKHVYQLSLELYERFKAIEGQIATLREETAKNIREMFVEVVKFRSLQSRMKNMFYIE